MVKSYQKAGRKNYGEDHAEIQAYKKVGKSAKGCGFFMLLWKPCAHYGKTPPCADAI
jgi:diaminohydroxyphosphoribosylaminopyrimidine deaminase/5-amino-6-(5-phosphoribosylamino)uracil reductase